LSKWHLTALHRAIKRGRVLRSLGSNQVFIDLQWLCQKWWCIHRLGLSHLHLHAFNIHTRPHHISLSHTSFSIHSYSPMVGIKMGHIFISDNPIIQVVIWKVFGLWRVPISSQFIQGQPVRLYILSIYLYRSLLHLDRWSLSTSTFSQLHRQYRFLLNSRISSFTFASHPGGDPQFQHVRRNSYTYDASVSLIILLRLTIPQIDYRHGQIDMLTRLRH